MSGSKSPLARLVLFIVCLSVAGAFVAGVYAYTVELPQQKSLTAPTNSGNLQDCFGMCNQKFSIETREGMLLRGQCYRACFE